MSQKSAYEVYQAKLNEGANKSSKKQKQPARPQFVMAPKNAQKSKPKKVSDYLLLNGISFRKYTAKSWHFWPSIQA